MRFSRCIALALLGLLVLSLVPRVYTQQPTDASDDDVEVYDEDDESGTAGGAAGVDGEFSEEQIKAQLAALQQRSLLRFRTLIPMHADLKFPVSEVFDILVGAFNVHSTAVNISVLRAQLMPAYDLSTPLYNFSAIAYNDVVQPGEHTALMYKLRIDPYFDPREYGLVVQAFYEDTEGQRFMSTVFNSTITAVDAAPAYEADKLVSSILAYSVIGAAVYLVVNALWEPSVKALITQERKKKSADTKKSAAAIEKEEALAAVVLPENVKRDFLPEHVLRDLSKRSGTTSPTKRAPSPKK
eukprot:ANDGO_08551.mRNA.1 Translocon-associated protein subunit alpha